jgi:hypothetical protein
MTAEKPDILWRLRFLADDVESAPTDLLEEALRDAAEAVASLRAELGIRDDDETGDESLH